MLVGGILFVHGQALISAAVGPDEDGRADHFATVGASPGLRGADIIVGCVFVALFVAPDALRCDAAVVGRECQCVSH